MTARWCGRWRRADRLLTGERLAYHPASLRSASRQARPRLRRPPALRRSTRRPTRRRADRLRRLRVDVHEGGAGGGADRGAGRDREPPDDDRHRRARRLGRLSRAAVRGGAEGAEGAGARLLVRGRGPADRRGGQRGAGHRGGGAPGRAVERRPVVHVASGGLTPASLEELTRSRPDVVLLVGGTDGGNAEVLLSCARTLAEASWPGPVVVAGNVEAQPEVAALLDGAGTPYVLAANVVPQIGVLAPDSARAAIREMFLRHVIGGKHLSQRADFTAMVRGATPDVVLTAVELLAHGLDEEHPGAGDVVVVDIGGATTDVRSVVELDPEDAGLSRQVVATVPVTRTVEGDLGMRWSAVSTVRRAWPPTCSRRGGGHARACRRGTPRRPVVPAGHPGGDRGRRGARRRGRGGRAAPARRAAAGRVRTGRPGRRAIGQGPARGGPARRLRRRAAQQPARVTDRLLGSVVGEVPGGWQLPVAPRVVVDREYVLAPAGLLAERHPEAAYRPRPAPLGRSHTLSPMGWSACPVAWTSCARSAAPFRGPVRRAVRDPVRAAVVAGARRAAAGGAGRAADRCRPLELQPGAGAVGRRPDRGLGLALPGDRGRGLGAAVARGPLLGDLPAAGGRDADHRAREPAGRARRARRPAPQAGLRAGGRRRPGGGGAGADLRRDPGLQGRRGPRQAGGHRSRGDPLVAEERPAAGRRLADRRLHQGRPGPGHQLQRRDRLPRDRGRYDDRAHHRGHLHRALRLLLLPRGRDPDLGLGGPPVPARPRSAPTPPARWPGAR